MDTITLMQVLAGALLALIVMIWIVPKGAPRNSGNYYPHPSEVKRWTERK